MIALGTLTLTVALFAAPATATAVEGKRGGSATIFVLAADPARPVVRVAVDGRTYSVSYGQPIPVRVWAGPRRVTTVSSAHESATVHMSDCDVLVALDPNGWQQHRDCATDRLDPDTASLRFVTIAADAGTVKYVVAGREAVARPGTATRRFSVPAGEISIAILRVGDVRPFDKGTIDVSGGSMHTAVLIGQGDTRLRVVSFAQAIQPKERPSPHVPVETDASPSSGPAAAVIVLAVITGTWVARRLSRRRAVTAAMLACVLVASCTAGEVGRRPKHTARPLEGVPSAPPPDAQADTGSAVRPRGIYFAKGVATAFIPTSTSAADRLHQVLRDPNVAWFSATSPLGELGATVFAGHASWRGRPGVFSDLVRLAPGDQMRVVTTTGSMTYFVESVRTYRKGRLPEYGAPRSAPTIVLISCTGTRDPQSGRLSHNVVVTASTDQMPPLATQGLRRSG